MRIGHGFDVHRFEDGDHIIIGGVRIAHTQALVAHSDGDVLIHALCDALLGAAALGDIGALFPDTDPAYAGADSRVLLREVVARLSALSLSIGNTDMTIVAQAPKMRPYIDAMRSNIAQDLKCDLSLVNVKATTTEGLGFAGRREGIAAHAVVLLKDT
ncbi:MAG: 2-C-methyl-D-erythritol 2,4-cyclodiphosphate synthase [Gammaproteobacteria bacterium]